MSTSSLRQIDPAIALGGNTYLVVWSELIPTGTPFDNADIYAVRVRASDGVVLDSTPIVVAQGAASQTEPAVAFEAGYFLVAWSEWGSGPPQIYGTRVRLSDGAVVDTPLRLSNISDGLGDMLPHVRPAVAADGQKFLVVWNGYVGRMEGRAQIAVNGIQGIWVHSSTGQLMTPTAFSIADTPDTQPRIAYGGARFLVAWQGYGSGSDRDIFGARVSAFPMGLIDTTPLRFTNTSGIERDPAVASAGEQFLVSWTDASNHVRGVRVRNWDGGMVDGSSFDLGEGGLAPVSAIYDGTDYRVFWQGPRGGERTLVGVRVSPTSGPAASSEVALSPVSSTSQSAAAAVASVQAGDFLVAYARDNRIKLRRVVDVVEEEPCETQSPSLSINGPTVMTIECGPGTYTDPGAQAFDGCGNSIEVHAYNTGADSSGPGPNLALEGSYNVSYAAWTGAGSVNATRTVNVEDSLPPMLMLNGPSHMTHTCGSQWWDPGVVAYDQCYGSLTHTVWRSGEVNGWAEGVYTVTYTVTDGGGNSASPVTRTVEVVDCPW